MLWILPLKPDCRFMERRYAFGPSIVSHTFHDSQLLHWVLSANYYKQLYKMDRPINQWVCQIIKCRRITLGNTNPFWSQLESAKRDLIKFTAKKCGCTCFQLLIILQFCPNWIFYSLNLLIIETVCKHNYCR